MHLIIAFFLLFACEVISAEGATPKLLSVSIDAKYSPFKNAMSKRQLVESPSLRDVEPPANSSVRSFRLSQSQTLEVFIANDSDKVLALRFIVRSANEQRTKEDSKETCLDLVKFTILGDGLVDLTVRIGE